MVPTPIILPQEVMTEILSYVVALGLEEGVTTMSFATLDDFRLVCWDWKNIVDAFPWKVLIAAPDFLSSFPMKRPLHEVPRFIERINSGISGNRELDKVSFCYDCRHKDMSLNFPTLVEFISVLSKCREIELVFNPGKKPLATHHRVVQHGPPLTQKETNIVHLESFSWTSTKLGIRDSLPEEYRFPWDTLKADLPWSNLTCVHLDCPLDIGDAYFVLDSGKGSLVKALLVQIDSPIFRHHWNPHDIVFSHLESLTLGFRKLGNMKDLVPYLDISQITHLAISVRLVPYFTSTPTPASPPRFIIQEALDQLNVVAHHDILFELSIIDGYNTLVRLTNDSNAKFGESSNHYHPANTNQVAQQMINLPFLTSLSIESSIDLRSLFSGLSMPQLNSLEWTVQRTKGQPPLVPSVQVPWNQLQGLIVHYNAEPRCDLSAVLAQCNRLESLTVTSETRNLRFSPGTMFGKKLRNLDIGVGVSAPDVLRAVDAAYLDTLKLRDADLFSRVLHLPVMHLFLDEPVALHELRSILRTTQLQKHLCTGHFHLRLQDEEAQIEPEERSPMQKLQRLTLVLLDRRAISILEQCLQAGNLGISRNGSQPALKIVNKDVDLCFTERQ